MRKQKGAAGMTNRALILRQLPTDQAGSAALA